LRQFPTALIGAMTESTTLCWYDSSQTPQDRPARLGSILVIGGGDLCPGGLGSGIHSFVKTAHDQVCQEISGELQEMAGWLSGGELSPEQFRLGLTRIEDQKLKRFGLRLSSMVSDDGIVHFSLRFADSDELCASMDVDSATGELTVQPACRLIG
jgi:hypothetical protein